MNTRLGALLASTLLMSACATTTLSSKKEQTDGVLDLAGIEAGVLGLRPLASAELPANECGMVLWTLEGNRPSAVFQFISGKEARVNIAGKPINLTRTDYDGASGYGIFERQVFESKEGVSIEVSARFGLEFSGGAYLEHGLIKVRDAGGWSMVSPTAGVAGCRR
ncbi:hypothetical protein [Hyphococcus sp.]|uniref:hypothetical protein n=1 Tax=Hyphococcus sp. TaxID=2038636 RepID=UPI0020891D15|nr:MAG: hypothetical protein DHS20C04_03870 [Marinicaulis sp.]